MKHEITHDLGQTKAREVTLKALEAYRVRFAEYDPKMQWKADNVAEISCTIKAMKIGGTVDIRDKVIVLDVDVPFLLRPFKGVALEAIEGEIRKWMQKEKTAD